MATLSIDEEILKSRGIDPRLASVLGQRAVFAPGVQRVSLKVNGESRGEVEAVFADEGRLCVTPSLLKSAGLAGKAASGCPALNEHIQLSQLLLQPQDNHVEMVVPDAALLPVEEDQPDLIGGGMAGLFNYDAHGMRSQYAGQSDGFVSASTELGFNAGNWIIRSAQFHNWHEGRFRTRHLNAYAQRGFAGTKGMLQLGQIKLFNPVVGGARALGMQWLSDPALVASGRGPVLRGYAQTQARVEVYQGGVMIYSTVVGSGPFELTGVTALDQRRDTLLVVIEADGSRHEFDQSAALLDFQDTGSGFSFGLGQLLDTAARDRQAWVASAGWSQPLGRSRHLSLGTQWAEGYRSAGSELSIEPWSGGRLRTSLQASSAQDPSTRGTLARVSAHQSFGGAWKLSMGHAWQSRGFRQLGQHSNSHHQLGGQMREQTTYSMAWGTPAVGTFNFGHSATFLHDGRKIANTHATWGRSFGQAAVSVSADRPVSSQGRQDNRVHVSVSFPLGESRRLRSTWRKSGADSRWGTSLQEQVNEQWAYDLGIEHQRHDSNEDINGRLAWTPRFAQINAGYTRQGQSAQTYSGGVRGAVAVHPEGVMFSPYAIQDTFGVVKLDGIANAQIDTPSGRVWTGPQGLALIPRLAPYVDNNIQVVTSSLPRNVDVERGASSIQARRGAVAKVDFPVKVTRRALFRVTTEQASPVPDGATVVNGQGRFITLVQQEGRVFIPDINENTDGLWVEVSGQPRCRLHFSLPDQPDPLAFLETAPARCIVI